MAFLNKEGLERLWQHIVAKIGNKADKIELENGETLNLEDVYDRVGDFKKGTGENTAILGTDNAASTTGRNAITIGGHSHKGAISTYYKQFTANGTNTISYTGTLSTTYWKVNEKVIFTKYAYTTSSVGGPQNPLGEGIITAVDTTAKTITFDVIPPTGATYAMLAAGNTNTHKNSAVIGSGLTSVGNDSLVVGRNNAARTDGLFVVGDGNENTSKANAFEIYKSSSTSTYSYGLVKSGMYVGSAQSSNLVQTAASVINKIQEQVPGIVQPQLDDKLDKTLLINELASGDNFYNITITYNTPSDAQKNYAIQVNGSGSAYLYSNITLIDGNEFNQNIYTGYSAGFNPGISTFPSLQTILYDSGYTVNDFAYPITVTYGDDGSGCDSIVIAERAEQVELQQLMTYPDAPDNREKVYIDMSQLANGPIYLPKSAIVGGIFIEGEIEGEVYLEPIELYEDYNGTTYITSSITITNANQTESIIDAPWFDDAHYYFTTSNYGNTIPSFTGPGNTLSEIKYYYYGSEEQAGYTKSVPVTLEIEWEDESLGTSSFTLVGVE